MTDNIRDNIMCMHNSNSKRYNIDINKSGHSPTSILTYPVNYICYILFTGIGIHKFLFL